MAEQTKPNQTKPNQNKPEYMVIKGTVIVPFSSAAAHMAKILPEGIVVEGIRASSGDIALDTTQVVKK